MNDVYEQITKDANFKAVKENGNNCYLLDYARHRLPRVLFGVTSSKDVERTAHCSVAVLPLRCYIIIAEFSRLDTEASVKRGLTPSPITLDLQKRSDLTIRHIL